MSGKSKCNKCSILPKGKNISKTKDLTKIIEAVKEAITNNILIDKSIVAEENDFMVLSTDGPWEDMMTYTFECVSCNARYQLTCDSYHGRGKWSRVDK
jgi:selenophosphate synthetase-related protein